MNAATMKWLIRREFWEHKGSLLWTPAAFGLAMIVFTAATVIWSLANGTFLNGKRVMRGEAVSGDEIGFDTLRFRVLSTALSDGGEDAGDAGLAAFTAHAVRTALPD